MLISKYAAVNNYCGRLLDLMFSLQNSHGHAKEFLRDRFCTCCQEGSPALPCRAPVCLIGRLRPLSSWREKIVFEAKDGSFAVRSQVFVELEPLQIKSLLRWRWHWRKSSDVSERSLARNIATVSVLRPTSKGPHCWLQGTRSLVCL
jgi:hypothetical protein